MLPTLIRDIIAANEGTQPERFQFVSEPEPENTWFQHLFSVDLRALASLRIFLGAISAIFVFGQIPYSDLLYNEDGILTQALNRQLLGSGFWSILWIDGVVDRARLLLIVTGIVSIVFALGYLTRFANFVLLILLWSIQVRNPLILTGGDVLLRMLLFWTLFLPTNVVWSIDAWQSESKKNDSWKYASIATMGIMLQVVFMYFFTGVAKLNAFWLSGDAVEYALNLEMSVRPLGRWLAGFPIVLKLATYATVFAEIMILFLVFVPKINHLNRGMMLGFFLSLHIGIWMTMSIGLFSLTAIVAWIVFFPSDVFNTFFGEPVGYTEKNFYQGNSTVLNRMANIIAAVFLVLSVAQNLSQAVFSSNQATTLDLIGRSTMTTQQFHMFAEPPLFSPWFEYNAQLDGGERVDIFYPQRGNTIVKPESVFNYMQTQNWRRIHWNLITNPVHPPETELIYQQIRKRLLEVIVERWDRKNLDNPVFKAQLYCHLDPIKLKRNLPDPAIEFANHKQHDLLWAKYER